ncbi:MAG: sulfate transporter, periplasmic sulfate-binding protein [Hyphomicrobiales bacterium]|nr:sulfate transporter, periplasmic sulfate-binding protein [Hyphomicrobiales bacterium]
MLRPLWRRVPRCANVLRHCVLLLAAGAGGLLFAPLALAQQTILNVSHDPTRELYRDINAAFVSAWKARTGQAVTIRQSHSGSGEQARAVVEGLRADVVTLGLAGDIDLIAAQSTLIPSNWQARLPHNSSPYTSPIVLLVRQGNPKGVRDWGDLARPGVSVVTPNPKTSGGARWNYLAAWAWAKRAYGDESKVREFMAAMLKNVHAFDKGARSATMTFAQDRLGDVLVAWENEAFFALEEFGSQKFEIVVPSLSILAEPPVAIVDRNVDRKGTRALAQAYLEFLYTPAAQAIIAKRHYRPRHPEHAHPDDLALFPRLDLVTVGDAFGGWAKAQKTHFADGGTFDQLHTSDH